jgi:glycine/D-amino acid oxidase-like deaminating enzyme
LLGCPLAELHEGAKGVVVLCGFNHGFKGGCGAGQALLAVAKGGEDVAGDIRVHELKVRKMESQNAE